MRILFVSPTYEMAKYWFRETTDSIMRGRNSSGVKVLAWDLLIRFPDGGSFQFVCVRQDQDLKRLRGFKVNAIVEHHEFMGSDMWYKAIKPHLIDNRI